MKTKLAITIKGNNHTWDIDVFADKKYLKEWQDDGIDIYEVLNDGPKWVVDIGLTRVWCFLEDLFYFKNPFKN